MRRLAVARASGIASASVSALFHIFTALYAKQFAYSGADDFSLIMGEERPLTGLQGFADRTRPWQEMDLRMPFVPLLAEISYASVFHQDRHR